MARVTLTPIEIGKFNEASEAVASTAYQVAVDASEGASLVMSKADQKYLIVASNAHASAAKKLTVKAGNGIQGVKDLEISIPFGKTLFFSLESGAFKNVSGADKGLVLFAGESADIKIAVIVLP